MIPGSALRLLTLSSDFHYSSRPEQISGLFILSYSLYWPMFIGLSGHVYWHCSPNFIITLVSLDSSSYTLFSISEGLFSDFEVIRTFINSIPQLRSLLALYIVSLYLAGLFGTQLFSSWITSLLQMLICRSGHTCRIFSSRNAALLLQLQVSPGKMGLTASLLRPIFAFFSCPCFTM